MSSLEICPLQVSIVNCEKVGGVLVRLYKIDADFRCEGFCNDAQGAVGFMNDNILTIQPYSTLSHGIDITHSKLKDVIRDNVACPYLSAEEIAT